MTINNPLKNIRIEFHILQSFPVTCLNRDDVGAPKTAVVGGVQRARVSSQAWKRPVRMAMHDMGITHGTRTKFISRLIANACLINGATAGQAQACGDKIEGAFIKKKEAKNSKKVAIGDNAAETMEESISEKTDTLLFLSPNEVQILALAFKEKDFNPNEIISIAVLGLRFQIWAARYATVSNQIRGNGFGVRHDGCRWRAATVAG